MVDNIVSTMHLPAPRADRVVNARKLATDAIVWCPTCGVSRSYGKPYEWAMEHTARTEHVTYANVVERLAFTFDKRPEEVGSGSKRRDV